MSVVPKPGSTLYRSALQSAFDLLIGLLVEAMNRFGIEAEEDGDAVARAAGYLGGGDAGHQPQRDTRVPEGIGFLCERRSRLGFRQHGEPSGLPGIAVLLGEQVSAP